MNNEELKKARLAYEDWYSGYSNIKNYYPVTDSYGNVGHHIGYLLWKEKTNVINQLREENERLKESNKVLSQYIEDCRPKLHPPFCIDTAG